MGPRTSVIWDDVFTAYDFGPEHPMGPVRLDLTTRLARALGVLDHVDAAHPEPVTGVAQRGGPPDSRGRSRHQDHPRARGVPATRFLCRHVALPKPDSEIEY